MSNPNDFDDDIPFRLPIEPGYEDDDQDDDIYTADTEDLDVVNLSQEMTNPALSICCISCMKNWGIGRVCFPP